MGRSGTQGGLWDTVAESLGDRSSVRALLPRQLDQRDYLHARGRLASRVRRSVTSDKYLAGRKPAVVLVAALAAHLAAWPAAEFVFTTELGRPIRRTSFSARVWQPAVKDAGLPRSVTFHALRHFYASLLIRRGESVKTVQARLGHASAAETLDTYSHLWPDSDDRTRAAVDSVLLGAEDRLRTAEGL